MKPRLLLFIIFILTTSVFADFNEDLETFNDLYAKRHYEGQLVKAIALLEQTDPKSLSKEDQYDYYISLSKAYQATYLWTYDESQKMGFLNRRKKKSESEDYKKCSLLFYQRLLLKLK